MRKLEGLQEEIGNRLLRLQRCSKWGGRAAMAAPLFFTLNLVMVITAAIHLVMIVTSFSLFGNGDHC